jgi:outer membrane immunogenic protein
LNFMRKYVVAALLAGTLAAPAFAQDAGTLGGFRVEGIVGYETTDVEDEGADGLTYGLGLGYDVQSGGAVFGVEAEATESEMDECVTGAFVAGDTFCARAGRDLYAGARVGAAIGTNSLVYLKGGYTNARIKTDYTTGVVGTEIADSFNLDGARVGGGLQFGLGTNAYAKAEYRYSNYEDGFDKHQGVVGLGFRF